MVVASCGAGAGLWCWHAGLGAGASAGSASRAELVVAAAQDSEVAGAVVSVQCKGLDVIDLELMSGLTARMLALVVSFGQDLFAKFGLDVRTIWCRGFGVCCVHAPHFRSGSCSFCARHFRSGSACGITA